MPDITLTTAVNNDLAPVLAGIATLTPPPNPKGRYVLMKALDHSQPAYQEFAKREQALVARVAVRDEKDQPVLKPLGDGRSTFEIQPELREEYAAEMKELLEGTVILRGARAVTRAELGACPITIAHERVLVSVGLLVDEAPE